MSILLLAEHNHKILNPATLSAVTAASQIGGEVHLLVAGKDVAAIAAQAARVAGVAKVLVADSETYHWPLAENIAPLIALLASGYTHVLAAATSTGKDVMPRAAALMDMAQISDIIGVVSPNTFRRPIYAGNAIETVQSADAILFITVRQSAFAPAGEGAIAAMETLTLPAPSALSSFVETAENVSLRPDLGSARVIVSGGRGLGSAENFRTLEAFADALGAGIGASRAAVDAGFVPNDYQVGQTGKIVAPELYIAVGISGAIQHLAGMKDSKVIVAINKDAEAPIFGVADYGLEADLFKAVPELVQAL